MKNNKVANLVRFKDNLFLIDAGGKGHFRNVPEALEKHNNKVSFIVMPGELVIQFEHKQGRIHGYRSPVRLGRGYI